jgi:GNAT superfamily N-acetyltransferase
MIDLRRTTASDPDFQSLVAELDKEFWLRYPATQQNFAPHNKIDRAARVVVAYADGKALGCGCFRPIPEARTIEIKRMFVLPSSRGRGIARKVLEELETWRREDDFIQSKLETGNNQPEAVAVYKRALYRQIPNYPPYTNMADSICMAKMLK